MSLSCRWLGYQAHKHAYHLECTLSDPELLGARFQLQIQAKATANRVPLRSPEHRFFRVAHAAYDAPPGLLTVLQQSFVMQETTLRLEIPAEQLQIYNYAGEALTFRVSLLIRYRQRVLLRLPLTLWGDGLFDFPKGLSALAGPDPGMLTPALSQRPLLNLLRLPVLKQAQLVTVSSLYAGSVAATGAGLVWLLGMSPDSMGAVLQSLETELLVWGAAYMGSGLYLGPKIWRWGTGQVLASYAQLLPQRLLEIHRNSVLSAGDLFTGQSRCALKNTTLRVVAVQKEACLYTVDFGPPEHRPYGALTRLVRKEIQAPKRAVSTVIREADGHQLMEYPFVVPVRTRLLYEKTLPLIAKGQPIEDLFQEPLELQAFFDDFARPFAASAHYGVRVEWHVQLLTPGLAPVECVLNRLVFDPLAWGQG